MTSFAQRLTVPTLLLISIGGCATGAHDPDTISACPPLIVYAKDQQTQLADELDALPPDAVMIRRWLADYILTRDQLRACQPKRTAP